MEPEFGVGMGSEPPLSRPKPGIWMRALEIAGMILLIYGLAASHWIVALFGAAAVLIAYRLYRRKHGTRTSAGATGDADSGGD